MSVSEDGRFVTFLTSKGIIDTKAAITIQRWWRICKNYQYCDYIELSEIIGSKEGDLRRHGLIEAYIREEVTPKEIFFVVDKTSNFDRVFWYELLDALCPNFQASVGDQKLWFWTSKLPGWSVLLSERGCSWDIY